MAVRSPLALAVVFCKLSSEDDSFANDLPERGKQLLVPLSVSRASSSRRHNVVMMDCRFLVNRGKET